MFDFVTNDDCDWRSRLMDRTYLTQVEKGKGKHPDYDEFRDAVGIAWNGVLSGIEWRFCQGVQWALMPEPPEDPEMWAAWEDEAFDPRGQPMLFYDPDFERRFFEVLVKYGQFDNVREAALHCGLADRYVKRGEWMLRLMADMWLELPSLYEAEIKGFYDKRRGEKQLSLLDAMGWA